MCRSRTFVDANRSGYIVFHIKAEPAQSVGSCQNLKILASLSKRMVAADIGGGWKVPIDLAASCFSTCLVTSLSSRAKGW